MFWCQWTSSILPVRHVFRALSQYKNVVLPGMGIPMLKIRPSCLIHPGVRDKRWVSEIDLSQPRHETAFWWRHNKSVTSQLTDRIKWPNYPVELIGIYVHINKHNKESLTQRCRRSTNVQLCLIFLYIAIWDKTVLSITWESPYLRKTVFILRRGPGSIFHTLQPGDTFHRSLHTLLTIPSRLGEGQFCPDNNNFGSDNKWPVLRWIYTHVIAVISWRFWETHGLSYPIPPTIWHVQYMHMMSNVIRDSSLYLRQLGTCLLDNTSLSVVYRCYMGTSCGRLASMVQTKYVIVKLNQLAGIGYKKLMFVWCRCSTQRYFVV